MTPLRALLLSLLAVAAACGRSDDLEHRVRNYDVVEEGSASGVTTSLGGEQAGSVPSLTATNVDTTTDLTLLQGTGDTAITGTAPGSLAETLQLDPAAPPARGTPGGVMRPPAPAGTVTRGAPAPARPAREMPAQRPARETPAEPTPAPPAEQPAEQPPAQQPPAEQPPAPEPTPPPTDTTTTSTQPEEPPPPPTNTAPPPDPKPPA